ncbi:glycoside hydrolase family 13 protein [Lacticaseibacillus salsurivasis]|uniref:glycoside hydrolase family 13 protein n=1 Tax=Lacticaseibacillus salsurivasis TaxID=3081441 RepID=UPI0030C71AF8
MNTAALKHRPDSEDCYLLGPNQVEVRFHTAKGDVAQVNLLYGDPYLTEADAGGRPGWVYQSQALVRSATGTTDDHWTVAVTVPYRRLQYLFQVVGVDGTILLATDRGLRADTPANRQRDRFPLPYLHAIDAARPPAWAAGTVWYELFPERFANGDMSNDPAGARAWEPDTHPSRTDYFGGDLQGVLDHLGDLEALGINGLYFCPLFTAPSNHKYDTVDHYAIDPAFGDKALFAQVVSVAHQRGMKVMLDGVFNHLGAQSPQWQDVVKHGRESRFAGWFHLHGPTLAPNQTDPLTYDTFAFEASMPKLNTANPEVQAYLLGVATYWLKQFDIDAWRLDVANEVDHHFWRRFRAAVRAVKPDCLILGEVWHSSQPWLNGDQFDGVMNYPATETILAHFLTGELDAPALVAQLADQRMWYRTPINQAMLNLLDSHDTPRLLSQAGGDQALALQALVFMFLQPGMPGLYYGTEMGMTGGPDPDNRRPMAWPQLGSTWWQKVQAVVRYRRQHAGTLGTGEVRLMVTAPGLLRVTRSGAEQIVGYFNTTSGPVAVAAAAGLSQGYQDGILAPKGFVIGQL